MPTYDTLTDDASSFPASVRTPDGSAPRNATTEAGPLQDLANRTAFLKKWGPDRSGSILDMRGLANPQGGDDFFTVEFGQYTFHVDASGGTAPFTYPANDGTTGRWVSPMIRLLCGQAVPSGSPAVILSSLIPLPSYPRYVGTEFRTCAIFGAGTQHITASTYVQVNDGAADLSATITCAPGDRVKVSIGPIYGNTVADADTLTVNAHVVDGGGSADYPLALVLSAPAGANVAQVKYLEFEHLVTAGPSSITVYLQAKCSVGGAGYVHFDAFGPVDSQWLRAEVIR